VEFFDAMESDNYYYIVQELCDGGDLRSMIREERNLP
jgi:serine/threonine protein kinase